MDKEDILKKSRKERKDEWSLFVENKAMAWGYIGAIICVCVFLLINIILDNREANVPLQIVLHCTFAFSFLAQAKYTRKTGLLITSIILLILCIAQVYLYIQIVME